MGGAGAGAQAGGMNDQEQAMVKMVSLLPCQSGGYEIRYSETMGGQPNLGELQ